MTEPIPLRAAQAAAPDEIPGAEMYVAGLPRASMGPASTDNDHLSCFGEPAQLGDGPALYMRPEDLPGTIRFWPSGEIAEVADTAADLWVGVRILGTPYEAYILPEDLPGTFRIRRAEP